MLTIQAFEIIACNTRIFPQGISKSRILCAESSNYMFRSLKLLVPGMLLFLSIFRVWHSYCTLVIFCKLLLCLYINEPCTLVRYVNLAVSFPSDTSTNLPSLCPVPLILLTPVFCFSSTSFYTSLNVIPTSFSFYTSHPCALFLRPLL